MNPFVVVLLAINTFVLVGFFGVVALLWWASREASLTRDEMNRADKIRSEVDGRFKQT